jgi:hypothetical protein
MLLGACSPAGPATPYTTNFEQWTQTQSCQAEIAVRSGQLHIIIKQPDTLAWSVAGQSLTDFTLDVDAESIEGPDDNGYGVIVRHVDDDNFYSLQVSGDGYFLVQKRVKGKWANLTGDWQPAPAIRPGKAANHLRVTCQGSTLTFSVNDTQLAQVNDKDLARGDIGVIAATLAEPGAHIAFGNVTVKRE